MAYVVDGVTFFLGGFENPLPDCVVYDAEGNGVCESEGLSYVSTSFFLERVFRKEAAMNGGGRGKRTVFVYPQSLI